MVVEKDWLAEGDDEVSKHIPNYRILADGSVEHFCWDCLSWYPGVVHWCAEQEENPIDCDIPDYAILGTSIKGVRLTPDRLRIERQCNICKRWLPATFDNFRYSPSGWNELSSTCVTCENEHGRNRTGSKTKQSSDWNKCLEYFNHRCAVCGRPAGLWHTIAADHWMPLTRGGTDAVTNIIPLCHGVDGCNNSKSNKEPFLWLADRLGAKDGLKVALHILAYFARVSR